jgi:hypothetical protein
MKALNSFIQEYQRQRAVKLQNTCISQQAAITGGLGITFLPIRRR